jgi:hypothetical protein
VSVTLKKANSASSSTLFSVALHCFADPQIYTTKATAGKSKPTMSLNAKTESTSGNDLKSVLKRKRSSEEDERAKNDTQEREFDAFAHYSNDEARMKRLLLKDDDEDFNLEEFQARRNGINVIEKVHFDDCGDGDIKQFSSRHEVTVETVEEVEVATVKSSSATERKKRLSFEVHPSLMMYDMFLQDESLLSDANVVGEE